MIYNTVLILDFGAQYSQLIARRVREAGVYCEVVPYHHSIEKIKAKNPKGIILSGGPLSVNAEDAPKPDNAIYSLNVPILGICYGGQLITQVFGGKVSPAESGEYGKADMNIHNNEGIFKNLGDRVKTWMSHFDFIEKAP